MKFNRFEYESVVDGLKDWYSFHDAGAGTDCVVILHGHGSHGDQLLIRPDLAPWLASLDRFGVSVAEPPGQCMDVARRRFRFVASS